MTQDVWDDTAGDAFSGPAAEFLAEAAALAERRAALAAELWTWANGLHTAREVLIRRDLDRVNARLARLAADGRLVLAVVDVAGRQAMLEAAVLVGRGRPGAPGTGEQDLAAADGESVGRLRPAEDLQPRGQQPRTSIVDVIRSA